MQNKILFSPAWKRQFFGFALTLVFGVGFLGLTFVGSAQESTTTVVNRSAAAATGANLPKSTVRGRIVYEDTEKPVRRMPFSLARLSPEPLSGNSNVAAYNSSAGITDANGEFELRSVFPGKYRLRIDAPNVLNDLPASNSSGANSNAELANVTPDAQELVVPSGGAIDVLIRARRGAAIGGKISYSDGDAAAKVAVTIIPRNKPAAQSTSAGNYAAITNVSMGGYSGGMTAVTDDRGVYRVVGLLPGEYIVRATERTSHNAGNSRESYSSYLSSFLSFFYPNATEISKATTLQLSAGQELSDVDFTLAERALFKAAGKVVERGTNQAVPGALIVIKQSGEKQIDLHESAAQTQEIVADEHGAFNLTDLPAGKYSASVRAPFDNEPNYNDDDKPKTKQARPSFVPVEKEFEITAQNINDLLIELPPGARLAGKVVADNNRLLPEYMGLFFVGENGKGGLNTTLSSYNEKKIKRTSAEFEIINVPPGKYTPAIYADFGSESGTVTYLKSARRGANILTLPFEIKEGEVINDLTVVLGTDGGRLQGIARTQEQLPVANKLVLCVPTDPARRNNFEFFQSEMTDANGSFKIQGAPGEYFVIFTDYADMSRFERQDHAAILKWLQMRTDTAQTVTIKPNAVGSINLVVP